MHILIHHTELSRAITSDQTSISIYLKGGCMFFFVRLSVYVFFFVRSRFSPRLCEPEGRAIAHSKALSICQIWFSFDFWFSRSFARKSGKTSFSRQFSVYPTINWGIIQFFGCNFWLRPYFSMTMLPNDSSCDSVSYSTN